MDGLLFHFSVCGVDAAGEAAGAAAVRLNLGTYLLVALAADVVIGSDGRETAETGSIGLGAGSVILPRDSRLNLSFCSSSSSLRLCFSAISSSLIFFSASSFFFLSASEKKTRHFLKIQTSQD